MDLIRQLQVRFDVVSVEDLSLDCVEGYTHILIYSRSQMFQARIHNYLRC